MIVSALFHGEQAIGTVEVLEESTVLAPDEHILIVRLQKQTGLVKELMKEDLISFDIVNLPAAKA